MPSENSQSIYLSELIRDEGDVLLKILPFYYVKTKEQQHDLSIIILGAHTYIKNRKLNIKKHKTKREIKVNPHN